MNTEKENVKTNTTYADEAAGSKQVTEADIEQFSKQCEDIFKQVRRDVIGQQEVV